MTTPHSSSAPYPSHLDNKTPEGKEEGGHSTSSSSSPITKHHSSSQATTQSEQQQQQQQQQPFKRSKTLLSSLGTKKYFHSRHGGVISSAPFDTKNNIILDQEKPTSRSSQSTSNIQQKRQLFRQTSLSNIRDETYFDKKFDEQPSTTIDSNLGQNTPSSKTGTKLEEMLRKQIHNISDKIHQQNQNTLNFVRAASNVPRKLIQNTLSFNNNNQSSINNSANTHPSGSETVNENALGGDMKKRNSSPNVKNRIVTPLIPQPTFASHVERQSEHQDRIGTLFISVFEFQTNVASSPHHHHHNTVSLIPSTSSPTSPTETNTITSRHQFFPHLIDSDSIGYCELVTSHRDFYKKTAQSKRKVHSEGAVAFSWNEHSVVPIYSETCNLFIHILLSPKQNGSSPTWIGFTYIPISELSNQLSFDLWQPVYNEKNMEIARTFVHVNVQYQRMDVSSSNTLDLTHNTRRNDAEQFDTMGYMKGVHHNALIDQLNLDDSVMTAKQARKAKSALVENTTTEPNVVEKELSMREDEHNEDEGSHRAKQTQHDGGLAQNWSNLNQRIDMVKEEVFYERERFLKFKQNGFYAVENKVLDLEQQVAEISQLVKLLNQENKQLKSQVTEHEEDVNICKQKIVTLESHIDDLRAQQSRKMIEWLYLILAYVLKFVGMFIVIFSSLFSNMQLSKKRNQDLSDESTILQIQHQLEKQRENFERLAGHRFTPIHTSDAKFTEDEHDETLSENSTPYHHSNSENNGEKTHESRSAVTTLELDGLNQYGTVNAEINLTYQHLMLSSQIDYLSSDENDDDSDDDDNNFTGFPRYDGNIPTDSSSDDSDENDDDEPYSLPILNSKLGNTTYGHSTSRKTNQMNSEQSLERRDDSNDSRMSKNPSIDGQHLSFVKLRSGNISDDEEEEEEEEDKFDTDNLEVNKNREDKESNHDAQNIQMNSEKIGKNRNEFVSEKGDGSDDGDSIDNDGDDDNDEEEDGDDFRDDILHEAQQIELLRGLLTKNSLNNQKKVSNNGQVFFDPQEIDEEESSVVQQDMKEEGKNQSFEGVGDSTGRDALTSSNPNPVMSSSEQINTGYFTASDHTATNQQGKTGRLSSNRSSDMLQNEDRTDSEHDTEISIDEWFQSSGGGYERLKNRLRTPRNMT